MVWSSRSLRRASSAQRISTPWLCISSRLRSERTKTVFSLSLNGCIWIYRPDRCYQDRLGTNIISVKVMFKRYPFVQGMIGIVIGVVTFVAKKVRKRRFCAMPLYKSKRSFYQDRFGTNIGKVVEREIYVFSYRRSSTRTKSSSSSCRCEKRQHLFLSAFPTFVPSPSWQNVRF